VCKGTRFWKNRRQPYLGKIRKTRSLDSASKKKVQVHGWRHPRELMRGVDKAIPGLVGKQTAFAESTRLHVVARCAGEQVERDREPPGRNIRPPRSLSSLHETYPTHAVPQETRRTKPWKRLEQGLRTTDLLLQSGGWGIVVFDLGGISWVDARRINLSMWFRFRRAIENTPTILLLLGEESCAKSCASLVLRCQRRMDNWSRAAARIETGASTFEGFEYGASRFQMAAKSVGIRPHVGAEISVEGFGNLARPPSWMPSSFPARPVRVALLVKSRTGYQNLCRLMTRCKLREKEKGTGTATLDEVAEHAEGLVSMANCYLASQAFAGTTPRPNVHPCMLQGPPRMSLILNAL
jgi:PHP domain